MSEKAEKIGFIGTGVMGSSMVRNLMRGGYELHIYSRTQSKAASLIEDGAVWHDCPYELASGVNALITMVGYPKDVKDLYLANSGILDRAQPGSILIDMTTSSPSLAKEIHSLAKSKGIETLDAPVSGGDIGAQNGTLSIMVGGDKAVFSKAGPILGMMGKTIVYQGPAGSGQYTKMANQIAIASGMIGVCESLAFAKNAGLELETVLKSISGGAAGSWSLSNLAPRMIAGDYSPGFYVKHFLKDIKIALESAEEMNIDLPGLQKAYSLYDMLSKSGYDQSGTQALYQMYADQ